MIIEKFSQFSQGFVDSSLILENVKAAKAYLFKKAIQYAETKNKEEVELLKSKVSDINLAELDKIIRSSDPDIENIKKLAQKIKTQVEDNKDLEQVKKLLTEGGENSPGYTYLFLRFRVDESIPFNELQDLLKELKDLSQYLNKLPMQLDRYSQIVSNSADARKGYERLIDDLEELKKIRATDRFVRELPGEFIVKGVPGQAPPPDIGQTVPSMKLAYQEAPDAIKKEIQKISYQFDKFGEEDGVVDEKKSKSFRDQFFTVIRSCRNLNDVIDKAKKHLKGALMKEFDYLKLIDSVNNKFGEINGAKVVYFENSILVTQVMSFQANKLLNGDTSHCVARHLSHWEFYVSSEGKYNNQYYIRNFNKGPEDNESVIGVTIGEGGSIEACFNKPNASFYNQFKSHVKSIGIDFNKVFKPMTPEEIEEKKKRDTANKNIVKRNITISQLKEYIKYGADPNAETGKPLNNAVSELNLDKVKLLIELGANPNIGRPLDKLTKKDNKESIEILKLLAINGAKISADAFDILITDYEILVDVVNSGQFDIKVEGSMALRRAALIGTPENNLKNIPKDEINNLTLKVIKLLLDYGADPSARNWYLLKSLAEYGRLELLEYIIEYSKSKNNLPSESQWAKIETYAKTSDLDAKNKKAIIEWINKQVTST